MKKFEKVEKIGYHSNFNFECNTERGFKESLSIALGASRLGLSSLFVAISVPSTLPALPTRIVAVHNGVKKNISAGCLLAG